MTSLCPVYEFLAGKMEGPVEDVRYKQLYHASMERCESLQQLVGKYSQLLPKHKRVIELKNKVISNLSKNKGLVDSYHECLGLREAELQQQIENWHSKEKKCEQEYGKLLMECEAKEMECEELKRVCGVLVARTALARAENTVREELIAEIKEKKTVEIEKMKKTFSKYSQSLKHKHKKVKESLEFSEAERAVLLDSNTELECQVKRLKGKLEETQHALEKAKSESSERASTPHPLSMPAVDLPPPSCLTCQDLSKQLRLALEALNDRGCAKYGDVLHSNFLLQQKVTAMELRVAEEVGNYQKSVEYIQEYKARSTEKVDILKENVRKADAEIAELDKLIDMAREALHNRMDLVKQSPQLLKVLRELDGTSVIE